MTYPIRKSTPKITRNFNFYGWAFVALSMGVIGIITIITGEFTDREGAIIFKEKAAVAVGLIFLLFALYSLYHLFFKAELAELENYDFHELEDFDDVINGYKSRFEIEYTALPTHTGGSTAVFYYILKMEFNQNLNIDVNIFQRGKLEYFFWKIGILRFFDTLTDNYYFDSRYKVAVSNKKRFQQTFEKKNIKLLEQFDRKSPNIRNIRGTLLITDEYIRYTEGPYGEDKRIFDPHRGIINNLFTQLAVIVTSIEKSLPEDIAEDEILEIVSIKEQRSALVSDKKAKKNLLFSIYRKILAAIIIGTMFFTFFANL